MKKSRFVWLLLIGVVILFSGCANHSIGELADPPGFLKGVFHGFIILFSFIGSLFTDYTVYAFPNSGGWYDFGFLLGVMMFFGSGGAGAQKEGVKRIKIFHLQTIPCSKLTFNGKNGRSCFM